MASVPMAELQALSKMDDYDRMLAMDRVARQYGVSVANLEKQLSGAPLFGRQAEALRRYQ